MRLKAVVAVVVLACASVLLGAYGLNAMAAETQTNYNFPPVIQKLVEKFNLDPAEVNGVLQEYRNEREAKRGAAIGDRLDQRVKEGERFIDRKILVNNGIYKVFIHLSAPIYVIICYGKL